MSERITVAREGCDLTGERWPGSAPLVVLLHEGVADRRGWHQVAERLAPQVTVVAYDRRGYGESPVSAAPFTHAGDLLAVLDRVGAERAWLVGASAGGGLALDTALLAPDRVAGLVLLGTAVSGAPEPELDPDTRRLDALLDAALAAGNLDEINRLETWLWLDGPAAPPITRCRLSRPPPRGRRGPRAGSSSTSRRSACSPSTRPASPRCPRICARPPNRRARTPVYLRQVDPGVTGQVWERFLAGLEPLRQAGKLGAVLFQFPQWFPISRASKDYLLVQQLLPRLRPSQRPAPRPTPRRLSGRW